MRRASRNRGRSLSRLQTRRDIIWWPIAHLAISEMSLSSAANGSMRKVTLISLRSASSFPDPQAAVGLHSAAAWRSTGALAAFSVCLPLPSAAPSVLFVW